MDGATVADYVRDAPDVEVREFFERMVARLSDREWDELKAARREHAQVRKSRALALDMHRREVAKRKKAAEEAERPARMARECEAMFANVIGDIAGCQPCPPEAPKEQD